MTETKGSDDLMTYDSAAMALGVSRSTLLRLVYGGKLPVVKVSAKIRRIRRSDIDVYLDAHRESNTPT